MKNKYAVVDKKIVLWIVTLFIFAFSIANIVYKDEIANGGILTHSEAKSMVGVNVFLLLLSIIIIIIIARLIFLQVVKSTPVIAHRVQHHLHVA